MLSGMLSDRIDFAGAVLIKGESGLGRRLISAVMSDRVNRGLRTCCREPYQSIRDGYAQPSVPLVPVHSAAQVRLGAGVAPLPSGHTPTLAALPEV